MQILSVIILTNKTNQTFKYKIRMLQTKCSIVHFVVLVSLLLTFLKANYIQIQMLVNVTQINTVATYTFNFQRDINPLTLDFITNPTPVPAGSTIEIVFPSDYGTISTLGTVPCTNTQTGQSLNCFINQINNTLTVTDFYSDTSMSTNLYPSVKVSQIINPSKSGETNNFEYFIKDNGGNIIDRSPSVTNAVYFPRLTFTPGTFTSCRISAQGATILTRSRLLVSLTPKNQIPSSGKVILEFPLFWDNNIENNRTLTNTPICAGIANISGVISCTSSILTTPVNKVYITISGLTSSILSQSFSFSVQSLLTPPYIASSQNILITSEWGDGSEIDTCSTTIVNLEPIQFQSFNFESLQSKTVSSSFNGRISVTIAKPFYYEDTIVLELPSEFLNATITSPSFSSFSQTRDTSASTITLSNFPSTSSRSTNSVLNFTLQNIVNPVSVKPVTLKIQIKRVDSLYQQSSVNYQSEAVQVTSFEIIPQIAFVNEQGPAQIQINSTTLIPVGAIIKISYPSTISANDLAVTGVSSALRNGINVAGVQFSVNSNTIAIDKMFSSNFSNGNILLNISQFKNPPTIRPSTYFLTIQTAQGYQVMSGSFTITSILKTLLRNQISSNSLTVLASSTITLTIETNFDATAISVIIPDDITIRNGFEATCLPNTIISCDLNSKNLTFIGNFPAGIHTLSWSNVQNPNSFQPTGRFQIYTYNRGWGVQKSLGFIFLQMTQTTSFILVTLLPSQLKNNENITLDLTITFPTNSPTQGTLSVIFPSILGFTATTCNQTCTIIGNNVSFGITHSISNFKVTLTNVKNAPSFQPVGIVHIYYENTAGYSSLFQTQNGWTNNIPSSFLTTVSSNEAYRAQTALFNFQLQNLSGKQTYVIIRFNDLFGELTSDPPGGTLLGSRLVKYNIQDQNAYQIYISLVTPVLFGDYNFNLKTYVQTGGVAYLIGESMTNIWHHSCFGTVCRACQASDNSKCIDCYGSAISQFYVYDTSSKTCIRECLPSFYEDAANICNPCSQNCLECIDSESNCTACNSSLGLFLDIIFKTCVVYCQDGFYENTQIQQCVSCSSPCRTCEGSGSRCTSCPVGKFLLNDDCVDSCPTDGQFISNSSTRRCDHCSDNCLTCENFTSLCTSCNVSFDLFLQNNACVAQCSFNSFVQNNQCVPCKSPCNLCFNATTVCSTCQATSSTPYYFNYQCINASQCPAGRYINIANASCDLCPPECLTCNSLIQCTACDLNFTLFEGQCLSECPNISYEELRVCLPCIGCLTCEGDFNNCTSCVTNQFLLEGLCYEVCPAGTYKNSTLKTCELCPIDCETCKNSTFCLTCVPDLYLYQGQCLIDCPTTTYQTVQGLNTSMQICQNCPISCNECSSANSCQSCATGYSLENDSICVVTCNKGISFNQVCYPCGLNCGNCDKANQTCRICDFGYLLYKDKCFDNCPSDSLTLDNETCVSCTVKFGSNCTTCSQDDCLSCSDGKLSGGECIPCPEGTYSKNSQCANCPSVCKSCFNNTFCIQCVSDFYLQENYCVKTCPLNKIPNGTACTVCLSDCAICNLTNSLCSVCSSGFYLFEQRCVDTCPDPLIVNLDATKCVTQEQFYKEYSQQTKVIYFPFSISTVLIVLIGIIIKCNSPLTHLRTFICAIVSIAEIGSWVAFLYVEFGAYANYHDEAIKGLALTAVAIFLLIILALVHVKFYCKYLTEDPLFEKWHAKNMCTDLGTLSLATLLNFKIYRLVHTRLLEREEFSMQLLSIKKLLPFSLLSAVSILVCSLPVCVGSSLALYFSIAQDNEFFAALDCLTVTSFMIILILLDLKHEDTYFFIEVQSSNLKRQMFDEDDIKVQVEGESQNPIDEKNMSKGELLGDQVKGQLVDQTAIKFRGKMTTNLAATQKNFNQPKKEPHKEQDLEEIDFDSQQQLQFQEASENGDQLPVNHQNILMHQDDDQMSEQISEQFSKTQPKWIEKQYDRHGYLLRKNEKGILQRFDENGYRVQIDQDTGRHIKFDNEGNQVEQINGLFYLKGKDGWYYDKEGNKLDKRGYKVVENEQTGKLEFFDQDGFRVQEDEQGNTRRYDQFGHQVILDKEGNIHRYTKEGLQAFVSDSGKVTYQDTQGNYWRKNSSDEFEMYDPSDGFILRKNLQTGDLQKYDKNGYRIEKDKWGNIYRYDQEGYRVVLGVGNEVKRFDKHGYEVRKTQDREIKLFDKDGYEVRIDSNGKKRLYHPQFDYKVIKDYDGEVTLYDNEGNRVEIQENGQHRRFNAKGLQIRLNQKGDQQLYDKRGNKVVQFDNGFYEKYDQNGNKIWLDEQGFEVEYDADNNMVRYDKIGNIVNEDTYRKKIQQQELLKQTDPGAYALLQKKKLRFKQNKAFDFESEYSKMVEEQKKNKSGSDSEISQIGLKQFHSPRQKQNKDFQAELKQMKSKELLDEQISQDQLSLNALNEIDHHPQKDLKEKGIINKAYQQGADRYQQGQALEQDQLQPQVQVKSVADAEINERSFVNQGVQPIDIDDSQCSELQSIEEINANILERKTRRKRGQHSQISFKQPQQDTQTQYNHNKKVRVQVKNKKPYDQNEEVQSLHEDNWQEQANQGSLFYNQYTKGFSHANTNTNFNERANMDDLQDPDIQQDTLSQFLLKQDSGYKQKESVRYQRSHRGEDSLRNTIEQMQNQLFERELEDQGIKERTDFILSNGPNPLVEYAKNLQAAKLANQQKMYVQEGVFKNAKKRARKK